MLIFTICCYVDPCRKYGKPVEVTVACLPKRDYAIYAAAFSDGRLFFYRPTGGQLLSYDTKMASHNRRRRAASKFPVVNLTLLNWVDMTSVFRPVCHMFALRGRLYAFDYEVVAREICPQSGDYTDWKVEFAPADMEKLKKSRLLISDDGSLFQLSTDGTRLRQCVSLAIALGRDVPTAEQETMIEVQVWHAMHLRGQSIVKLSDGCILYFNAKVGSLRVYGPDLCFSHVLGALRIDSDFAMMYLDVGCGLLYLVHGSGGKLSAFDIGGRKGFETI